ncbi:MAG TPA: AI-2E family transporter, partial [Streptosporangiaceae bacterium]|nr:AI-2E family transporter [Streptosporangiaceae bacterium]
DGGTRIEPPAGLGARLGRLWRGALGRTAEHEPSRAEKKAGGAAHPATASATTAGAGYVGAATRQPGGPASMEPGGEAAGSAAPPSPDLKVPRMLQVAAAWSWRLLLTGLVVYLAFRFAVFLRLVTLPFIAAMLGTALLQPLAAWLRRRGFSPLLSTWCVFFLALIVIAGAITLLANQISSQYPVLFSEVQKTATQIQHSLAGPPFHLSQARLSKLSSDLLKYISQHKSVVAGTVLTGGKYAAEFITGIIVTLFISFFLLKDGAGIWRWLIHGMAPEPRRRMAAAGDHAWRALVNYMRGTTLVAVIHSLLLGIALYILGVPLVVPLMVLVFIAAFIPLIGILLVGGLAILIALVTKGLVAAVILLAVLLVENQIEGHLLQPLVVGRIIKLHPLAIILVLAVGGVIAGIPGAIIAVPTAAVITYAWPALRDGPPSS